MAFNPVTLILFFLSLIPGATLTPRTCDHPFRGPWQTTYDVFLSFRGGDTRQHFTDHLYKALTRAGIPTIRDDDEIRIGENIELEIQKAIQESKSSIIVFSKNYSSSRWCLDELLMIMERRRTVEHLVFPVFYDVDPSEVENQTGQFGEEFAKLEGRFKYQMERVEGWRMALKEASNLEDRMALEDRGGDTRQHFTDHLYKALTRAGIPTFRDDDEIRIGENIELEIQKAIQESKSSIIVFSKNYSSSRWCLDELLMIMERRRTVGHLVFPVFYDVDPSEVGNQTGQFGEEFAKLEIRFKYQMEGWRRALKEAAKMERMVLEDRYESKFIESIVKEIADKVNLSLPHVPPSALPLSSALRPPSYFFGLLREWRRSFFQTPSLFLFFFEFTPSL